MKFKTHEMYTLDKNKTVLFLHFLRLWVRVTVRVPLYRNALICMNTNKPDHVDLKYNLGIIISHLHVY